MRKEDAEEGLHGEQRASGVGQAGDQGLVFVPPPQRVKPNAPFVAATATVACAL
jgi:hypothetical protein